MTKYVPRRFHSKRIFFALFSGFRQMKKPFLIPARYSFPYPFDAKKTSFAEKPRIKAGRLSKICKTGIFL
jgi:hypothetical protein